MNWHLQSEETGGMSEGGLYSMPKPERPGPASPKRRLFCLSLRGKGAGVYLEEKPRCFLKAKCVYMMSLWRRINHNFTRRGVVLSRSSVGADKILSMKKLSLEPTSSKYSKGYPVNKAGSGSKTEVSKSKGDGWLPQEWQEYLWFFVIKRIWA